MQNVQGRLIPRMYIATICQVDYVKYSKYVRAHGYVRVRNYNKVGRFALWLF